jgi:hypothetical protein
MRFAIHARTGIAYMNVLGIVAPVNQDAKSFSITNDFRYRCTGCSKRKT